MEVVQSNQSSSNTQSMTMVAEKLQSLAKQIEDAHANHVFAPQQAHALRDMSDVISSQIAKIPTEVLVLLSPHLKNINDKMEQLIREQCLSAEKINQLLQGYFTNSSPVDSSTILLQKEMLRRLTKSSREIMVRDAFLGEGAYGEVYLGHCQGKEAAIKVVSHSNTNKEKTALENEAIFMDLCRHHAILQVLGIVHLDGETRIAMELASRGTLSKYY